MGYTKIYLSVQKQSGIHVQVCLKIIYQKVHEEFFLF